MTTRRFVVAVHVGPDVADVSLGTGAGALPISGRVSAEASPSFVVIWSSREDSHLRPLAPQASALTRLRHGSNENGPTRDTERVTLFRCTPGSIRIVPWSRGSGSNRHPSAPKADAHPLELPHEREAPDKNVERNAPGGCPPRRALAGFKN